MTTVTFTPGAYFSSRPGVGPQRITTVWATDGDRIWGTTVWKTDPDDEGVEVGVAPVKQSPAQCPGLAGGCPTCESAAAALPGRMAQLEQSLRNNYPEAVADSPIGETIKPTSCCSNPIHECNINREGCRVRARFKARPLGTPPPTVSLDEEARKLGIEFLPSRAHDTDEAARILNPRGALLADLARTTYEWGSKIGAFDWITEPTSHPRRKPPVCPCFVCQGQFNPEE